MKWYEVIQKYFGLIFIAALSLGFFFPPFFRHLSDITYILLGIIITISFLTLDMKELRGTFKRFYIPVGVFLVYKIILPVSIYYLLSFWNFKIALAALLLAATPVGMITPALTQLIGGDRTFVVAVVVLSSFAAPFYLPFLIKALAGTSISVNPLAMMFSLVKLIFIPFVVSLLLRRFGKSIIDKTRHVHGALSILLLVLVLSGVSAQGASIIRQDWITAVKYLGLSVLFCGFLAAVGFGLFWFLHRKKRFGLAVAIAYMNLAMAIVIASKYFDFKIVLFCIMYEIPVNLLPVALRHFRTRTSVGNRSSS